MDLANDRDAYTTWVYYYRMRKSMPTSKSMPTTTVRQVKYYPTYNVPRNMILHYTYDKCAHCVLYIGILTA